MNPGAAGMAAPGGRFEVAAAGSGAWVHRLQHDLAVHRGADLESARRLAVHRDQGQAAALAALARRGDAQELET
jgi:hypothetical protein